MAYNEMLAQRIRTVLEGVPGVTEKKMFGGTGFILRGNMACGVNGDDLIVRVGPEKDTQVLAMPHVRRFDMSARPMAGWIMVAPPGYQTDADLRRWIEQGMAFAGSLPPK